MTYRPPEAHLRALTAAIGAPEQALAAYTEWRHDSHQPDAEERRLLALIAANVVASSPDDKFLAQSHLERRRTLATHLRRVASCKQITDQLAAEGIESLWFKGIGMLPWYRDPSVRTMFDADLLVPWQQRHETIDHLAARGFVPVEGRTIDSMHTLGASLPGWGMRHPNGAELDVHWRPVHHLAPRPQIDAELFTLARLESIASVALVVPDPSHHLTLVVAHGMRTTSEAHLISLVDACHLLRAPDFDARRAADLAQQYERTTALIEACVVLDRLQLPADLIAPVAALRSSLRRRTIADRMVARVCDAPDGPLGPAARTATRQYESWRALSTTPLRRGGPLRGFVEVVRARVGAPRARNIPAELLWRATGRPATLERFRGDRGAPAPSRPRLTIGDQVRVGETNWLSSLLPSGWWDEEGDHVWTRGEEALIDFDVDLGAADGCVVTLVAAPFLSDDDAVLSVKVRINRRPHDVWVYAVRRGLEYSRQIPIDAAMLDHGRCQIMLIIDGASSPRESGISDDQRVLGLSLSSLTIGPIGVQSAPDPKVRATLRRHG